MDTFSCPGSIITYTCVVNSSSNNVITLWSGSAFQCSTPGINQIVLVQRAGGTLVPFIPISCGSLSAMTTDVTSSCYTSVLTIPAVQALNGTTVMCMESISSTVVGSDTVKIISEYLCTH